MLVDDLQVRAIISDFAVMIAIVLMVLMDFLLGLPTPKLLVPDQVQVRAHVSCALRYSIVNKHNIVHVLDYVQVFYMHSAL